MMVLKKLGEELLDDFTTTMKFLGEDQGLRVLIEPAEYEDLKRRVPNFSVEMPYVDTWAPQDSICLHQYVDFIVCLGGDGLMLHATHLFGCAIPPIISFKLGSLGFLTCHDFEHAREHLDAVINGSDELDTCRLTNSEIGRAHV